MRLAHLRIAQMHLAVEVICQTTIIVEAAEVGAADVADLQLLVAAGARGVVERLELALLVGPAGQRLLQPVVLLHRDRHAAQLAQRLDLLQPGVDAAVERADLLEQCVRLSDLVRVLLESPLHVLDAPVALVDVLFHLP